MISGKKAGRSPVIPCKPASAAALAVLCFVLYSPKARSGINLGSAHNRKLFPFSDNFMAFFVDSGKAMSYHFPSVAL